MNEPLLTNMERIPLNFEQWVFYLDLLLTRMHKLPKSVELATETELRHWFDEGHTPSSARYVLIQRQPK